MHKWWQPVAVVSAVCALSLTVGCARLLGDNKAREANQDVPQSFGALATSAGPSVSVTSGMIALSRPISVPLRPSWRKWTLIKGT